MRPLIKAAFELPEPRSSQHSEHMLFRAHTPQSKIVRDLALHVRALRQAKDHSLYSS